MNISVVGLGKLGAVLAGVMADRGHHVTGVDLNPALVDAVNQGRAPVSEPGLSELVHRNSDRLSATVDLAEAVGRTDLTFVLVPTPSGPDGTFSLKYVLKVVEGIAQVLRSKSTYHLVVITSTVMPGSTGGEVLPMLEAISGKKCGVDFGLCYNPEFIALGSVIQDMSNPDMLLIGESDPRAGSILEDLYHTVCRNRPPVARMNFVNAELAKISVNTYVTTKISYANMLAEVCEKVAGADSEVVAAALGLDTRIGRKYLKGAAGYGGPCFPRDNTAFARFAEQQAVDATLAKATDQVNRRQVMRLLEHISAETPAGESIGLLGLSYKPDTEVIEESQGLMLASQLADGGYRVVVYDPAAMDNARRVLDGRVEYASSMEACAGQAATLVITTPWKQFQSLRPQHLRQPPKPAVFDWWRILPPAVFEPATRYHACGRGPSLARAGDFALAAADGVAHSS
ncbi:MAG TPA: nucleotide sugar dehydrogenase [Bryobacteraceae bacterium]|nr:nucleotide sugar dehydrogenase [Bryobacteraceae bacterium]